MYAYKDDPPYFSILNKDVISFYNAIEGSIASCDQDQTKQSIAEAALGCIERFRGCIMQIARISQHESDIAEKAPNSTGQMVALRGAEVLTDFESLLFHGRSTIDRLAFFIAKQIYGQDCDKYPKLANVLTNFVQRDSKADSLKNIVNTVQPFLEGVLFDASQKKSLRSHLSDKSTASENAHALFTLHCIDSNKRIAIDAILGDYALFKTSEKLGQSLSFLVLNSLSLCIGSGNTMPMGDMLLTWKSRFTDYRDYLSDIQTDNRISIWNTTPSGCVIAPVSIRPEIANEAY